jgi:hypothetical protein
VDQSEEEEEDEDWNLKTVRCLRLEEGKWKGDFIGSEEEEEEEDIEFEFRFLSLRL